MPTTSRGFRYPQSTDPPNIPLHMSQLAADVNDMWISSTAALRPAAAKVGRQHYATDTGQHSLDLGSGWVILGFTDVVRTGDSRLSNSRTPTGAAGGVLSGTYPNPGFAVDMATQAELDAVAASLGASATPPIGSIMDYAGSGDPANWALCDGRALNRVGTHAALFAAIGTTFGVGNGSSTFNIPDLRGRIAVGADNMGTGTGDAGRIPSPDTRGGTGGQHEVGLTSAQSGMVAHSHSGNTGGPSTSLDHTHITSGIQNGGDIQAGSGYTEGGDPSQGVSGGNPSLSHSHSIPTQAAADAAQAHTNMQPYQVVNKIIRVA